MVLIDEKRVLTREKRSSALSHYHGTLGALNSLVRDGEAEQTIRTFSQCAPDEIVYALRALSGVEDAAIVAHGAAGCCASGLAFGENGKVRWYSTNLDEKDTILGGDEKLREALARARAEQDAKVIFVVGTPVIAINNDDVQSVILEFLDEPGAKIIFIPTDGFKSKAAVTGYDIVSHTLLRELVERSEGPKEDFVNLAVFSEDAKDAAVVVRILKALGIQHNTLPRFSSVDGIRKAGKARATVAFNSGEGSYLARGLEESFGVTYLQTCPPIGREATECFVRAIAGAFALEQRGEKYIASQRENISGFLDARPLMGKSVFLNCDLAAAESFSGLVRDFGGRIAGLAFPYVDADGYSRGSLETLYGLWGDVPAVVANGQPFEIANALSKIQPDYYFSEEEGGKSLYVFAAQHGIVSLGPGVFSIYGYEGLRDFAAALQEAGARHSARVRAGFDEAFYKENWLKKSGGWYVKREVR
jgi:nitrogenase molybdenum-iron protein alpha chain